MSNASDLLRPKRARRAVAVFFFVNGFVFASWVPHIAALQIAHALSDGALGVVLLGMALGAIVALSLAGWLVAKAGSRRLTMIAGACFCLALPLPILSPGIVLATFSLALFGAFNATLDVAMNAQAVEVERGYRRAIMSSFHGLFSLGGLAGAASTGVGMAAGLPDIAHVVVVSIAGLAALLIALPGLVVSDAGGAPPGPVFVRPRGMLALLGVLALFAMLGEGAMADWSAVYLQNHLASSPAFAAAGFAAFSLTMAAGRFAGDRLSNRFGPARLLRSSGLIASLGLGTALLIGDPLAAVVGFGLVGLGLSNAVPVLFSAAGRVPGTEPGKALAAVAATGYLGFLVGPALIGLVAEATNLSLALGLVSLACAAIAVGAARLSRTLAGQDSGARSRNQSVIGS